MTLLKRIDDIEFRFILPADVEDFRVAVAEIKEALAQRDRLLDAVEEIEQSVIEESKKPACYQAIGFIDNATLCVRILRAAAQEAKG